MVLNKTEKRPFKYPRFTGGEITPKVREVYEIIKKWPGIMMTEIAEYLGRDKTTIRPKIVVLEKRRLIVRKHIKVMLEDGRVINGIGLYPARGKR